MPQYRTEVLIPSDRYLCLQLPAHLPTGLATVTVRFESRALDAEPAEGVVELDPDRQDIEWWDEFSAGDERDNAERGGPLD